MKNTVMVFTSKATKTLETMFSEGGSGYWRANYRALSKCDYIICTKSKTLAQNFPSDLSIKVGEAFVIGKGLEVVKVKKKNSEDSQRYLVKFSEYAKVSFPDAWTGNRNPVAYMNMSELENTLNFKIDGLNWKPFPNELIEEVNDVTPLTINEAKAGIAKTLGISPSCIEIKINA